MMKNYLLSVIAFFTIASCNKSQVNDKSGVDIKSLGEEILSTVPSGAYYPLVLISGGNYRGVFGEGPTVTITQPVVQTTCPSTGMPVNVVDGIPAWTVTMTATPNCSVELTPSTIGGDNSFVIVMGTFTSDIENIRSDVKKYNTAYSNYLNQTRDSNGNLIQATYPTLGTYIKNSYPSGSITYKGKLIRTVSGSGFALGVDGYENRSPCLNMVD